ncbi:unnamed protein product [Gordionus sp. m RMFG-2023]
MSFSRSINYCKFLHGNLYRFDDIQMNLYIFNVPDDNLWVGLEKGYENNSAVLIDLKGKFVTRGLSDNISNYFVYYGRLMKWIDATDPETKCVVKKGDALYSSRCDLGHPFCLKSICNIKAGSSCKFDAECLSELCHNRTCNCKGSLKNVNGLCLLEHECEKNEDCQLVMDKSYCRKNECECIGPLIMINGECVEKKSVGQRCLNHSECVYRQCQSRCRCPTGTFLHNNTCSEGRRLNQSCSNNGQCEAFNVRSTCNFLKGVCKCKERHTDFIRNRCGLAKQYVHCLVMVNMYHKNWRMFLNMTSYEKMLMTRDLEYKIHRRLKKVLSVFDDLFVLFNNLISPDSTRPHFRIYLYLKHVDDYLANVKKSVKIILPVEFRSAPYQYWDTPLSVTIEKVVLEPVKDMCLDHLDYRDFWQTLSLFLGIVALIGLPIIYICYLKRKRSLENRNPWRQPYFNFRINIPYTVQELRVTLTTLRVIYDQDPRTGLILEDEQVIYKMYDHFVKLYLKYYYEIYYDFDYKYEYDIDFDYWARFTENQPEMVDYSGEVFETPRKTSSTRNINNKLSRYMELAEGYGMTDDSN